MRHSFVAGGRTRVLSANLTPRWLPRAILAAICLCADLWFAAEVQAQPALENAVLNDRGISSRRRARASFAEVEGVEVGAVRFSLSASYSVEFNDNVNASQDDPEGDLIQAPSLTLGIASPLTERSDLDFSLGLGYRAYWHNEQLSGLTIRPGTVLAYDLQVKNVFISLFDRMSLSQDVATVPDVANQAQFPRFENTIGTQVTYTPGDFLIAGGYGYRIYRSTSDEFSYVNRDTHLPFLRAGYVFAQTAANAGVEFSATLTDNQSSTNSDSAIVSFGPYLDWQVSDAVQAGLRGGFLYLVNSLTILPEESFDANSFYVGLDVNHGLTDYIFQALMLNHAVRPSFEQGAAFTEETRFNYRITWAFVDPASLRFDLTYIHGRQSAAAGVAPGEVYDQWRVGVGLSYALTTQLFGDLAYDYIARDSDLANRSYTQNRVTLGLNYRFR